MDFNKDNQQVSISISNFLNRMIENPNFSRPSMETLKNCLISLQLNFVPKLAKLEKTILSNPTFIHICNTANIPKKYGFLGILAIGLFSVSSYTRYLWSKKPRMLSDILAIGGPGLACFKLIYTESLASATFDSQAASDESNDSTTTMMAVSPAVTKEVVTNKEKYKHWIVYWMFYGIFHLFDGMVHNKTQKILKKSPPAGTKRSSTNPFWYYWLTKMAITYWAGYQDGNVVLYQKIVIPCIRKYHQLVSSKQD